MKHLRYSLLSVITPESLAQDMGPSKSPKYVFTKQAKGHSFHNYETYSRPRLILVL